ncbi:MAG: glycosyltransferase [Baekduia sp.]
MSATGPKDDPVVVIGGPLWAPSVIHMAVQVSTEIGRDRDTLYIHAEAVGGGVGVRLWKLIRETFGGGREDPLRGGGLARTPMRLRKVSAHLWLASIGGIWTLLPTAAYGPLRRYHARRAARAARRWLKERGAAGCTVVAYWWFAAEVLDHLPEATRVIYDCTDEHTSYPDSMLSADEVREVEARLLDRADRTYVISSGLIPSREGAGRLIELAPNAFDLRKVDALREAGLVAPETLASLPRPIVTCVATELADRADWPLLAELMSRNPDLSFVFIGRDSHLGPPEVSARPNAHHLGFTPYDQTLATLAESDVAIIPFKEDDFAAGNAFAKLLDYFAMGVPVVSIPVADTIAFKEHDPELIELASGVEEWAAALERCVAEPADAPVRERRRQLVQERSTEARTKRLLG